jgi:hypothetical protein
MAVECAKDFGHIWMSLLALRGEWGEVLGGCEEVVDFSSLRD